VNGCINDEIKWNVIKLGNICNCPTMCGIKVTIRFHCEVNAQVDHENSCYGLQICMKSFWSFFQLTIAI